MQASVHDPLFAARVKLEVERRLFGSSAILRVGRFEVGERVGAGGMSVVYRARDPELDRPVALKLLQDGVDGERLLREARALARLRHPNVVSVYEVGRWAEHVFLALEHVDGQTFAEWCRGARSIDDVLGIACAIADGLCAVHDLDLVHRDVKPENVLVDARGAPRLVDFGLVTDVDRAELAHDEAAGFEERGPDALAARGPLTRPGATPGTPRYIAPERRAGAPASAASDQFSFGVMLLDALEGRIGAERARAVAARACAADPGARYPDLRGLRAALVATGRSRRSGPVRVAVPVVVVAVAVGGFLLLPGALPSASDAPLAAAASSDPPGYADLSAGTGDAEAHAAVRLGLLALRDGARSDAGVLFERAAERDPRYAAAHFWRALLASHGDVNGARRSFEHAFSARAGMSEALRDLLLALVPCIQADPIDEPACVGALQAAAAERPSSAHVWYELARYELARAGPSDAAAASFERALEADPHFVLALYAQAQTLAYLGRFDEALAATDACLGAVPGSDACLHDRVWIHAALGDCDAVLDDARRLRAAMPANPLGYTYLAAAALGRGDPVAVVREHLRQASDRMPEAERAWWVPRDEVALALLGGEFDAALAAVPALESALTAETDRATRLLGRRARILVALETGDREEARRVAEEAEVAMEAWAPDPRTEDFGIARDALPFLDDALYDVGALSSEERARRRDAWLAGWRARAPSYTEPFLWLATYARTAHDAEEAFDALAAMPAGGPPPFHPLTFAEPGIGRTYLHAGRAAEAVPLLRRAASGCHPSEFSFGLENGWETVRASRDLGMALEATGDSAGACSAYQRVLDRWGAATPRSVTADDARRRRAALGCE